MVIDYSSDQSTTVGHTVDVGQLSISPDALLRSSLNWMLAAGLQLSVVRSILFFVTLVLWTDEQYDYADVRTRSRFSISNPAGLNRSMLFMN